MSQNIIEEYLVRIGADIDASSFNAVLGTLHRLDNTLKGLKAAAPFVAIASGFAAVASAATDMIREVASADMQYRKLAAQMWITRDSAKALSTAMKVMGASQQDIAWVPELREQFFRLRAEINALATPKDADSGLRWIREIGDDLQVLQVRIKALKEWIVYYLIKYLQPYIEEFQRFVRWLSDTLARNLPEIAKKTAKFMGNVLAVGMATVRMFKELFGGIYRFVESLPSNVKRWTAVFAAVGAAIMASPFGLMIAAIGGAMLLIQDFMYYMNGYKSSKMLAPLWKTLSDLTSGGRVEKFLDAVRSRLVAVADILDRIVSGIDWDSVLGAMISGVQSLVKGLTDLYDVFAKLSAKFDDLISKKPQSKSFWSAFGNNIGFALGQLGRLIGLFGKFCSALAALVTGDPMGAKRILLGGLTGYANETVRDQQERGISNWGMGALGGGLGLGVQAVAGSYEQGAQWMGSVTTDPTIQCDSYTADFYRKLGYDFGSPLVRDTEFKNLGAYHSASSGYAPQPGDLVDFEHHVGIYLGGGKMISRQSSEGVKTVDMDYAQQHFGRVLGWGSLGEAAPKLSKTEMANAPTGIGMLDGWDVAGGAQGQGFSYSYKENSYAASLGGMATLPAFAAGGANNSVSVGNITVNVVQTNATGDDIADALERRIYARAGRGVFSS